MSTYRRLLERLGASLEMISCCDGKIKVPLANLRSPFDWYGFPPALIPIWSDGSSPAYFGLWKHWFTDRRLTYVQMYVEQDHHVVEIARTEAQFFCNAIVSAISVHDGMTPEIRDFADAVGVRNLDEIDELTLISGDNPKGFSRLPQFSLETPLDSVTNTGEYDGDFPTEQVHSSQSWMSKACSFELNPNILSAWPQSIEQPLWLGGQRPFRLIFDEILESGDLGQAWLALNSKGWTFADATVAIRRLAGVAEDEAFNLLASTWIETVGNDSGGY